MRTDRNELFSVEAKHVVITGGVGEIEKVLAEAFAGAVTALVDLQEKETRATAHHLTEVYGAEHRLPPVCQPDPRQSLDGITWILGL
jgi:NAD(P)-dependent dehydrogenase (short-subunit alcohol dehydrogenase family)